MDSGFVLRTPRNDGDILLKPRALLYLAGQRMEEPMKKLFGRLAGSLLALVLTTGLAAAQSKVTVAIGGGSCSRGARTR